MERRDWLSLVLFKLGWFVAVYGGSDWLIWQLPIVLAALFVVRPTGIALGVVSAVALSGILRDAALIMSGVLNPDGAPMPLWLALLWLQFALVLERGMHWMNRLSQPVQCVVGVVTGGLAYAAAVSLGAARIGDGAGSVAAAWVVIALTWGVLLWVQLRMTSLSQREGAFS